jgi:arsenite methyltransferase
MQKFQTGNPSHEELENWKQKQKNEKPLVASASVDLVVSNFVLNLVAQESRKNMIAEIFRVLKPGGRIAISDIVSDSLVPQHLQDDARLWSGCISGAYQEQAFLDAFLEAGFVAVAYDKWDETPWQEVEGIEFRSVTVTAIKPYKKANSDKSHEVLYKGPYAEVRDDSGNIYRRGERYNIDEATYQVLLAGPFADDFAGLQKASSSCCGPAKGTANKENSAKKPCC